MGNGPSLRQAIDHHLECLQSHPTLAVNFAANTPEFFTLRPRYYVLADPHFFESADSNPNVASLMQTLTERIHWEMTLFVPHTTLSTLKRLPLWEASRRSDYPLRIQAFNAVGVEGQPGLCQWLMKRQLAMPRPRNVLIPSLMIGVWLGFKTIYVAGADHSWTRTLAVNEANEVVSIQPHFYEEDKREQERITAVYRDVRLHEIIYSFYVAFKGYFSIEAFARSQGATIYNSTPGSFIDAFPRAPLPTC